ncbi:hypothetical protein NC651_021180 [Populus alba x Populus x berolinensis]|nr:hypothetical protein NC651_021180 [Populus alba x Populus x berolinensis]
MDAGVRFQRRKSEAMAEQRQTLGLASRCCQLQSRRILADLV